MQLDIATLRDAVATKAAIRRRQRLQPVGGQGDKIFPPTYPGEGRNAQPRHVYERRRLNGGDTWCVLVDSVQSQANRLEDCLLAAIGEGLPIPHVVVDFSAAKLDGITRITSLDAPHRVYDAILRDSLLKGEPFMKSAVGQRLAKAKAEDASAVLEVSPTALLFGAWHSTGEGGGLGAKFARCLVSEIVAIDVPVEELVASRRGEPNVQRAVLQGSAEGLTLLVNARNGELSVDVQTAARRTGSRIDPAGILKQIKIYRSAENELDWTPYADKAARDKKGDPVLFSKKKGDKVGKPSVINHGNIAPSVHALGVTCDYLEHSFVLSFAALRRLRFGGPAAKDAAGRALLAALGVLALVEQDTRGYALRSRCDLVCDGQAPLEMVAADGKPAGVEISQPDAHSLYRDALAAAKDVGFDLFLDPLELTPQDKLVDIIRKSQELALAGKGGDEDEAGDPAGSE